MGIFNVKMFEKILKRQVETGELSETTMEGYVRCIRQLQIECGNKPEPSARILEEAVNKLCQNNKQINKYISAIKKYERDVLGSPQILLYGEPLTRLRIRCRSGSRGKPLSCSEKTYSHKINSIKDEKMKLALRLQQASGLRISEIVELNKSDIYFDQDEQKLFLKVRNGKGGKSRDVEIIKDEYILSRIKELLSVLEEDEKLFYSAAAIKKKAYELGMETHDLRRINSRQRFRENISRGNSKREARSAVSRELGHNNTQITNLYLGDEWEKE